MKSKYLLFAVIGLTVVAAGCNKTTSQPKPTAINSTPQQTPISSTTPSSSANIPPTLGDVNAPITIVEYGHFKCPYCNRFFKETQPQIDSTYIKTGKVKFIWKDFPFEGQESGRASQAAYCANDQGKFWEFHDTLFNYMYDNYYGKGINGEELTVFTDSKLNELASQLGLDGTKFGSCLTTNKYAQLVKDNYNAGLSEGVKSTPTFFINGQKIVGAQPFSIFDQIIQSKLK